MNSFKLLLYVKTLRVPFYFQHLTIDQNMFSELMPWIINITVSNESKRWDLQNTIVIKLCRWCLVKYENTKITFFLSLMTFLFHTCNFSIKRYKVKYPFFLIKNYWNILWQKCMLRYKNVNNVYWQEYFLNLCVLAEENKLSFI